MSRFSDQIRRFKRWFIPRFIAYFCDAFLMRAVLISCRVEIRGLEKFMVNATSGPSVVLVWHNRIPMFSHAIRSRLGTLPISALISKSGDGDMLSMIIERNKVQTIRVAHDGRLKALKDITRAVKNDGRVLLMTPDGPRGPRYCCKPGALMAAELAGAKIMGITWSSSRFWQLKSWDRMVIPKPFSHIILDLSEPIHIGSEGTFEEKTSRLNNLLIQRDEEICAEVIPDRSRWPK